MSKYRASFRLVGLLVSIAAVGVLVYAVTNNTL